MTLKLPQELQKAWQLFLLALRYRDGDLLKFGGNTPFLLSGKDKAWIIYDGSVDLFSVRLENGKPVGARQYFTSVPSDHLLLGMSLENQSYGLVAMAAPDSEILEISQSRLRELTSEDQNDVLIAIMLENWIQLLAQATAESVVPKNYRTLPKGNTWNAQIGEIFRVERNLLWVKHDEGYSHILGDPDLQRADSDHIFPLVPQYWLELIEQGTLIAYDTTSYMKRDPDWLALDTFHNVIFQRINQYHQVLKQQQKVLIDQRQELDSQRIDRALHKLASPWRDNIFQSIDTIETQNYVLQAMQIVGQYIGVKIKRSNHLMKNMSSINLITDLAYASRIQVRMVTLQARWWQKDNGPLVGFWSEGNIPVALISQPEGHYLLHDPVQNGTMRVDEAVASQMNQVAFMLYRPLPDRALTAIDMLRFGLHHTFTDLYKLLFFGILGGLLSIATPIAAGLIFDSIIPEGNRSQLILINITLILSGISVALFQMVRSMFLIRVGARIEWSLQAAVIDRLLNLRTEFFRQFSAGDLSNRALGIGQIKSILSNIVIVGLLSSLFSIFNLILLFIYDSQLAVIATLFVFASIVITLTIGQRILGLQYEISSKEGEISGLMSQLLRGLVKIRIAGAEKRVFTIWANQFSEQKRLAYRARSHMNLLSIYNNAYPLLASIILFWFAFERTNLSTGTFLAFYVAFNLFIIGSSELTIAIIGAVKVVPVYERLKPILEAVPETDMLKPASRELTGNIEISRLSFRYNSESPLILDNIDLHIRSGEFIALVGKSGSGKSTILRHLLGFEMPTTGAIYYDQQPLSEIDLRSVRRQIGVVLQSSQLMTGSIYQNIVGSSLATLDDAWIAAKAVGIDEEIKRMPMGMHTFISEGGSTFSGGQRQRILIARALVNRPRIIFFDEATSALDDQSQSLVTESLAKLDATRIVIAHRLSTVQGADRILVLDKGRIVESGTYNELMLRDGLFSDLARRQLF